MYPNSKQYIAWREVPGPGGKPKKLPCDFNGEAIDPHDPTQWRTYDEVQASDFHIGFVLTANDPYFVVDIDECRDPVTGEYDQRARDWAEALPGTLVEISHSGTGVHFWGICEAGLSEHHKNRTNEIEFYEAERFIALGTSPAGSIGTDWTEVLRARLPKREHLPGSHVPLVGAVEEYTGPENDDLLVQMAHQARGSISKQFGQTASFADLWAGNAEVLAKFYPTDGEDPFDRSRADSALLSHLAFWTGKDQERMRQLWLSSPLAKQRPDQKKLQRTDYQTRSISGAAAGCLTVYTTENKNPPGSEQTPLPGTHVDLDPAAGGYLTIHQQAEHFKGCVYITEDNKILCPTGELLNSERFRVVYGGYEFQMQADGGRPTRNAWEAFTENRCMQFPKVRYKGFTPDMEFGEIDGDVVNTFRHVEHQLSNESADPFIDLVEKLLPDANDREIFLTWCAAMVQNPGRKFQWAIVLQGTEGNGKTFLLRCMEYAIGQHLTHMPNPEDMNEKYNTYLEGNLLIGVEEIHMEGRRAMLDRLKKYITNDRVEIRGMGTDKRMGDNLTNWMFCTNYQDAVLKTKNDRRYAILFTAQQAVEHLARDGMDGDYFPKLWDWARAGGFAAVYTYLKTRQLDDRFNPVGKCPRAPMTTSTNVAIQNSLGKLEQEISEAIGENLQGFRGGWISSIRLRERLKETGMNRISNNALKDALETLGYGLFRGYAGGRAPVVVQEGSRRPKLYCLPHLNTGVADIKPYLTAQGYTAPGDE